jgi:hypothetical protein
MITSEYAGESLLQLAAHRLHALTGTLSGVLEDTTGFEQLKGRWVSRVSRKEDEQRELLGGGAVAVRTTKFV